MGVDTLQRLINKRYYSNSDYEMVAALAAIESRGVDIFVGGRRDTNTNKFVTMSDFLASAQTAALPRRVLRMFKEISESDFRMDVTSTELRQDHKHYKNKKNKT